MKYTLTIEQECVDGVTIHDVTLAGGLRKLSAKTTGDVIATLRDLINRHDAGEGERTAGGRKPGSRNKPKAENEAS